MCSERITDPARRRGVRGQPVEQLIVVRRVMMEQREKRRSGKVGEGGRLLDAAVAPAAARRGTR